jgi:Polyketide cyclase / dehydrase and lipid transport
MIDAPNQVWIDQTATRIRVRATIDVPAAALFAVLADPRRHAEIDGSGMVQAAADSEPITATGQVFTMSMFRADLGEYRTDNHVLDFTDGRRIAWTTAREGQPPAGVRWVWALDPTDDDHTIVTHTYDWTDVTDPGVLARVTFPRVQAEELVATLHALEAAAR